MIPEIKPIAELVGHGPQYRRGVGVRARARPAAARARRQRQEGPGPPRDHPDALRARPGPHGPGRAEGLRPRGQALPGRLPSRGGLRAHARRDDRRGARVPHQRPAPGRAGLEGRLRRGGRPAARRRRLRRRPAAAQARPGRGRPDALGRVDAQGDPAAAPLHRRLAAGRDGDRRQGGRGRGAARGDEGLRASARPPRARRSSSCSSTASTSSARAARWWRPRRASR